MWSQCASAVSTCSAGWSLGSITSHPLPQSLLLVFHQPGSLTPTPPSVPILAIFCGQPKPYLSHRNVSAASFHNTCFLFYMTLDKLRSPSPECFAVQLLSCVWLFATPWTAACQASLSFTISQSLLKFTSLESVMSSNHLILCLPLLPLVFPSIKIFFFWPQMAKVLELQHQSFQGVFRIDFF